MDSITHELRADYWKDIIAQCQARPEGVTVKQWTVDNHISEKSYYYWLRRFRKETYELIHPESATPKVVDQDISFAELPGIVSSSVPALPPAASIARPDAVLTVNEVRVELYNTASDGLIKKIMAGIRHA